MIKEPHEIKGKLNRWIYKTFCYNVILGSLIILGYILMPFDFHRFLKNIHKMTATQAKEACLKIEASLNIYNEIGLDEVLAMIKHYVEVELPEEIKMNKQMIKENPGIASWYGKGDKMNIAISNRLRPELIKQLEGLGYLVSFHESDCSGDYTGIYWNI